MDPNTALTNLRNLVARIEHLLDADHDVEDSDLSELVDTFYGLDQWISKGGFLPRAWDVSR